MTEYFYIKSRMSELVWDVEGNGVEPGTNIVMYEKKDDYSKAMNQLFYVDAKTKTIRSALTDMCVSFTGDGELVVEAFTPNNSAQGWELDGDKVRNTADRQVADIFNKNPNKGTKVIKWVETGEINQQFDFQYVEPPCFWIESAMNGKVIDIDEANIAPGAYVIMWPKKDGKNDNQHWFTGSNNVIRSKLNGFTFDSSDGDIKLQPYDEKSETQGFHKDGDHIKSRHNDLCLDIKDEDDKNGAKLVAFKYHNGANQRWQFEDV